MSNVNRGLLIVGVLLALLFGIASDRYAKKQTSPRLDRLPIHGTGYAGKEIPLTAGETSVFGSARVVKRIYRHGKATFLLVVIDGSRYRHAVHDPIYCFKGMGWEVNNHTLIPIEGGEATRLTLTRGREKRQAIFWFSDGALRHNSVTRYWCQATLRRLTFGLSGPEPLFVILQPLGEAHPSWYRDIHNFGPIHDL